MTTKKKFNPEAVLMQHWDQLIKQDDFFKLMESGRKMFKTTASRLKFVIVQMVSQNTNMYNAFNREQLSLQDELKKANSLAGLQEDTLTEFVNTFRAYKAAKESSMFTGKKQKEAYNLVVAAYHEAADLLDDLRHDREEAERNSAETSGLSVVEQTDGGVEKTLPPEDSVEVVVGEEEISGVS